jgi:hypothetical protein
MSPHPAEKTDSRLHSPLSTLDADTTSHYLSDVGRFSSGGLSPR